MSSINWLSNCLSKESLVGDSGKAIIAGGDISIITGGDISIFSSGGEI